VEEPYIKENFIIGGQKKSAFLRWCLWTCL